MAVLSDADILSMLSEGSLRIEGFDERNLTPNGYDVTVEEVWVTTTDMRVREGVARIPSGAWFVVATKEYLELPTTIIGEIWIRTTWVRKGVLSSFGIIDAGFNGNLTFSAFNASRTTVELPVGERFAQVVFSELRSPAAKGYRERSGNYFGQRGVTLGPTANQKN